MNRIILRPTLMINEKFLDLTKEQILNCMKIASLFAEANADLIKVKLVEFTLNLKVDDYEGIFFRQGDDLHIGNDFNYFKNNTANTQRYRAKKKQKVNEIIHEEIVDEVTEEKPVVKSKTDVDYSRILFTYNHNMKATLASQVSPNVAKLNDKRKTRLKVLYKNNVDDLELINENGIERKPDIYEFYEFYFGLLADLNMYKKGYKEWAPDFDFSIKDDTYTKLKEGGYK